MVSGGIKDSFNFYHSQLRINIECAFGILVHRWGCLRKPIPMNITIPRICALVKCLYILHNYCINKRFRGGKSILGDIDSVLLLLYRPATNTGIFERKNKFK